MSTTTLHQAGAFAPSTPFDAALAKAQRSRELNALANSIRATARDEQRAAKIRDPDELEQFAEVAVEAHEAGVAAEDLLAYRAMGGGDGMAAQYDVTDAELFAAMQRVKCVNAATGEVILHDGRSMTLKRLLAERKR